MVMRPKKQPTSVQQSTTNSFTHIYHVTHPASQKGNLVTAGIRLSGPSFFAAIATQTHLPIPIKSPLLRV